MPCLSLQGVSGALTVLMKDAIKPNLMQTLEVSGRKKLAGSLKEKKQTLQSLKMKEQL